MQTKWVVAVVLLLGFACKKNNSGDCSKAVCPDVFITRPIVKFTLSDKATGQDLIFSAPPQYQLNDIVAFRNKNTIDTTHLHVYIDSLNLPKFLAVFAAEDTFTFFIQLQNQKADTIDIISKPVFTTCCLTGYVFNSIKLNGKLICTDCTSSTIVDIKK